VVMLKVKGNNRALVDYLDLSGKLSASFGITPHYYALLIGG
jgi:hypothetical protein